jgi:ATP-dependent DNA helicase RecG
MNLKTSIEKMNKVGAVTANRLRRLGIETVLDLLYWFPFRYEDYRQIMKIKDLQPDQLATIKVKIEIISNKRSFKKKKIFTEALVSDDSGSLKVVWFNQPFITKSLSVGQEIYLSGKVKVEMLGLSLSSPVYERADGTDTTHTARLVPMYSLTSGLTQKQMRFLVAQSLPLALEIPDWQNEEILTKNDLPDLTSAIKGIHFPYDEIELKQSTNRLKFDELFLIQLQAELSRLERKNIQAKKIEFKEKEIKGFVDSLPFILTKTQKISAWEILQDLAKEIPMNRMLSGDVGSGKTVVAGMVLYDATLNDYQTVLMAPTEILAKQHFNSLSQLFEKLNIKIGLFTRTQNEINDEHPPLLKLRQAKEKMLEQIEQGEINIIIGTHALLSEKVNFKNLGLVIVDEQHRFGVAQRKLIKDKGGAVHFLSMTATPIPRSLSLMLYGDLDMSIISELPQGRKKIITRLVEPKNREKAYEFIREQIKHGRQVFVICPWIEPTENDEEKAPVNLLQMMVKEKKTVLQEYEKLSKKIFPDFQVGYLHGKMPGKDKEKIMVEFKDKKIDILVSTSVVEVGVDIPNASVMMIEDAESFGLAQLHQFRGRVGRGEYQSYCFLFTENNAKKTMERLNYFEKENDGFKLAQKDLEIRGPGEVYGTEQSGVMNLRLAKLTDKELLKKAKDSAKEIAIDLDQYPALKKRVELWQKKVHLE